MAAGPPRRLVLTPRGRLVVVILAVLLVLALVLGIRAVLSPGSAAAEPPRPVASTAGPAPGSTSSTATTSSKTTTAAGSSHPGGPSTTARTPSRSSPTAAGAATRSKGAMPHSGLVGTGRFTTSDVVLSPARRTSTVHTFVVKVEGGVTATPNGVARQIEAILNDPRGWIGYRGASFATVADAARADFVIYLASPPTVDRKCAPLNVQSTWNCQIDGDVILNSDRWQLMTPTYRNLADYRAYMINHEVGHFLGRHHVGCPRAGALAPVMLQQSISLKGCVPNPWPRKADLATT